MAIVFLVFAPKLNNSLFLHMSLMPSQITTPPSVPRESACEESLKGCLGLSQPFVPLRWLKFPALFTARYCGGSLSWHQYCKPYIIILEVSSLYKAYSEGMFTNPLCQSLTFINNVIIDLLELKSAILVCLFFPPSTSFLFSCLSVG